MKPGGASSPVGIIRPVLVSAIALVLVAAASEYGASFERLKAMPAKERGRLLDNLRRFDLQLSPGQQSAARELDRRLSEMSPEQRAAYLAVLRRYHAWLNSLPEQRQDELTARPPGERMALVRTLVRDRPVPVGETPPNMRLIEPGQYNPFEVVSAFKIWRLLDDTQRAAVQRATPERARREALFRIGERPKFGIPRETRPEDFDEEKWIGLVRAHWGGLRPIALMEDAARARPADAVKKKVEPLRPEIQRRQAINFYVSKNDVRSVDPERLSRFIEGLPPWIPASLGSLSPDEARRRMAFAYRLVFPDGQEIGATRTPAPATAKGIRTPRTRVGPPPKAGPPPRAKSRSAQPGENPTPF